MTLEKEINEVKNQKKKKRKRKGLIVHQLQIADATHFYRVADAQ